MRFAAFAFAATGASAWNMTVPGFPNLDNSNGQCTGLQSTGYDFNDVVQGQTITNYGSNNFSGFSGIQLQQSMRREVFNFLLRRTHGGSGCISGNLCGSPSMGCGSKSNNNNNNNNNNSNKNKVTNNVNNNQQNTANNNQQNNVNNKFDNNVNNNQQNTASNNQQNNVNNKVDNNVVNSVTNKVDNNVQNTDTNTFTNTNTNTNTDTRNDNNNFAISGAQISTNQDVHMQLAHEIPGQPNCYVDIQNSAGQTQNIVNSQCAGATNVIFQYHPTASTNSQASISIHSMTFACSSSTTIVGPSGTTVSTGFTTLTTQMTGSFSAQSTLAATTGTSSSTGGSSSASSSTNTPAPPTSSTVTTDSDSTTTTTTNNINNSTAVNVGPVTPSSPSTSPTDSTPPPSPPPGNPAVCANGLLQRCLNSWLHRATTCKDNTDNGCYCKDADFISNVQGCIGAWGNQCADVNAANNCFLGICAAQVAAMPILYTGSATCNVAPKQTVTPGGTTYTTEIMTTTVSTCPSGQTLTMAGSTTVLQSDMVITTLVSAAAVRTIPPPMTTITISTAMTITVPCSETACVAHTTVTTMSSILTVPAVQFTAGPNGATGLYQAPPAAPPPPAATTPAPYMTSNGTYPMANSTTCTITGDDLSTTITSGAACPPPVTCTFTGMDSSTSVLSGGSCPTPSSSSVSSSTPTPTHQDATPSSPSPFVSGSSPESRPINALALLLAIFASTALVWS